MTILNDGSLGIANWKFIRSPWKFSFWYVLSMCYLFLKIEDTFTRINFHSPLPRSIFITENVVKKLLLRLEEKLDLA